MSDKTKAILLGGLVIGLISAIPIIGWFWFAWAFLGGGLAGFFYVRKSSVAVQTEEGVLVGLLTGILGGVLNIIVYSLLQVARFLLNAAITASHSENGEDFLSNFAFIGVLSSVFSAFWIIFNLILIIPITLLSLLGGLAGVAVFEKRNPQPAQFSNRQGGNYYL